MAQHAAGKNSRGGGEGHAASSATWRCSRNNPPAGQLAPTSPACPACPVPAALHAHSPPIIHRCTKGPAPAQGRAWWLCAAKPSSSCVGSAPYNPAGRPVTQGPQEPQPAGGRSLARQGKRTSCSPASACLHTVLNGAPPLLPCRAPPCSRCATSTSAACWRTPAAAPARSPACSTRAGWHRERAGPWRWLGLACSAPPRAGTPGGAAAAAANRRLCPVPLPMVMQGGAHGRQRHRGL